MNLYTLPPLDMQMDSLSRDQQPTNRMLLGITLFAACGLLVSWLAHSPEISTSASHMSNQPAQVQLAVRIR